MTEPVEVPGITPTELKARLDAGDVPVLVDVRELYEADIADLPDHGQIRIPTPEFAQRYGELDPDQELVLYCRTGRRSEWAARVLLEKGYRRVLNLKGGVLGWRNEVDPDLPAY
ncbi:MAG TPA: rhodanese-like domain-containing protein [Longimicrobiales bacterium]|nr:rhodanese-like domain-containing protein [Longimicrobiales bacterium]